MTLLGAAQERAGGAPLPFAPLSSPCPLPAQDVLIPGTRVGVELLDLCPVILSFGFRVCPRFLKCKNPPFTLPGMMSAEMLKDLEACKVV